MIKNFVDTDIMVIDRVVKILKQILEIKKIIK